MAGSEYYDDKHCSYCGEWFDVADYFKHACSKKIEIDNRYRFMETHKNRIKALAINVPHEYLSEATIAYPTESGWVFIKKDHTQ